MTLLPILSTLLVQDIRGDLVKFRHILACAVSALLFGATGAGAADAAKLCAAASGSLKSDEPMSIDALKDRLSALDVALDDKEAGSLDVTCKMTAMMGGMGLPLLHLMTKADGTEIKLTVQVDHQAGPECEAIILGLQGC